jgi:hypothetical protein
LKNDNFKVKQGPKALNYIWSYLFGVRLIR